VPGLALYLIVLPHVYGFSTLGRLVDLFLMAVPFVLSVSFLAQFVGAWFERRETAVLLFIAVSLPLFFMVGVSWPVEAIPSALRSASRVFPSTSAIDGLVRINQMGATLPTTSCAIGPRCGSWSAYMACWLSQRTVFPAGSRSAMAGRSLPRWLAAITAIAFVGCAVRFSYHWASRTPAKAQILGVVRETEIHISPETSARLASFQVIPGQKVHKGDILALLSSPEIAASVGEAKAAAATARADRDNVFAGVRKEEVDSSAQDVRIAEANLALEQQQYARAAALASREFATKQHLDESATALKRAEASLILMRAGYAQNKAGPTKEDRASAEAKVALADATLADLQAKLAKTVIMAPVDGVVGSLVAEPGEAISPGQSIMTLEGAEERWVTFTVREDRLEGISIGAPLTLLTARGDRIPAHVTELRPLGEFATWRAARAVGDHDLNSFLIRADPSAEARALEPGMTVWLDRAGGADGGR
jgi:multidrug resistance efflux pump